MGVGGRLEHFEENELNETVRNVIEPMASDGLRTIGIAYKDLVLGNPNQNQVRFVNYFLFFKNCILRRLLKEILIGKMRK